MTELDDAWVGSAGSPTFPLLDDVWVGSAGSPTFPLLDDIWVGSAGSPTFPLLDDKVTELDDKVTELVGELVESAEVTLAESAEVAEESGCVSGPLEESSEHAARMPATANAVASFAMKDADVCRAFLMLMETS